MSSANLKEMLEFDKEIHSLLDSKPPVSASKIQLLTRIALKHSKLYKNVVYSIEKFIQKCPPEYKLAGLYVVDSIARAASKVPQGEGENYIQRLGEKLESMFPHLILAPSKDKEKMKRVVGLWKKGGVFQIDMLDEIQQAYFSDDGLGRATAINSNSKDPRLKGASNGSPSLLPNAAAAAAPAAPVDTLALISTLSSLTQISQQLQTAQSTPPAAATPNLDLTSLLPLLGGSAGTVLSTPQAPALPVPAPAPPPTQAPPAQSPNVQNNAISQLSSLLGLGSLPGLSTITGLPAAATQSLQAQAQQKAAKDPNDPRYFDYDDEDDVGKSTKNALANAT
ncbi:RNA binding protein Nrd1, partial [Quaeritorhiza haematococci]